MSITPSYFPKQRPKKLFISIVFFAAIFISLFFPFSGCSSKEQNLLNRADYLMEEYPDSALRILESIDRHRLSDRSFPYFALLMTQAMVKADVPLDSDSLISMAYRRYANDWYGDKGIRATFYMGETAFNREESREAMRYYLLAHEESIRLGNHYWRAKSAERIADLFFNSYNYREAAKYRREAIQFFGKAGRLSNQRYAVADLATDYMNDSKFNEAIVLLDSVCEVAITDPSTDAALLEYINRAKVNAQSFLGRFDELTLENKQFLELPLSGSDSIEMSILKLRFPELQTYSDSESAIISALLEKTMPDDEKALAYYAVYEYATSKNDYSLKSLISDSLIFYQNAVAQNIIRESVTASERDFYLNSSQMNHQRMTTAITIIFIILIMMIIASVVVWRLHKIREMATLAERDANVEALAGMKAKSERMEEVLRRNINEMGERHTVELERREAVMTYLFKEKWSMLSRLCEDYYEKGSSVKLREAIQKRIENEVKSIRTPEGLHMITEDTDRFLDGMVSKLRQACPNIKERDIQLCSLMFAGFSVRAICFILGITTNNFYVRKKRTIERINSSDTPLKSVFIKYLH